MLLCSLLIATTIAYAQPAPPTGRSFSVEPTILANNNSICQVLTIWKQTGKTPAIQMLAHFAPDGELTKLEITAYRIDADSAYFVYPKEGDEQEIKSLKSWTEFAKEIRGQFRVISDNLYVEAASYKVIATTKILDGFEGSPDLECLVLKNRFRTISVPLVRWVGRIPEEGESLHLGRDRTFGGALFAVEGMSYGGYGVDSSTMDCLREYRKVRQTSK